MNKITVKLKKTVDESYDIIVGRSHTEQLYKHLRDLGQFFSCVIITDNQVKNLLGGRFLKLLKPHFPKTILLSFPAGEKFKTQKTKTFLEEQMLNNNCGRDTLIIALGGGVVGDMAGFVAATYMRGIPYVQVPTTLLAMVDSSLGGKTGIDAPQGKNLIGSFHQPKKVFVDLEFLKNLPEKQILNGCYEIIKMAITSDPKLFVFAEKHLAEAKAKKPAVLEHLITRGLKIKARIVEADEKESHDRMILNFGHTIGHALEQLSGYKLMHGEAVALGVIAEAKVSVLEGLLHKSEYERIVSLLVGSGLNPALLKIWTPEQVIKAARKDKKTRGQKLRVVLIEAIGRLHRREGLAASFISDEVIKKALVYL